MKAVVKIFIKLKPYIMKTVLIKFGLLLVFLAFVDYVVIALMGCVSCVFGADENYFCSTYCWMVKTFAAVTFAAWLVWFSFSMFQVGKKA